ncbi:MAG: ECF-type sigma factor [Pseudomonadota bacterium]
MQLDDKLLSAIQPDLERIAASRLATEQNCSLAAPDLVNEAFVRIMNSEGMGEMTRARVLALVSHVMRNVLIDHARRKLADKRAHQKVTLVTGLAEDPPLDLIELDLLLEELAEVDRERADLVEMRFFGGMTIEEIAEVTGTSPATIKRRWTATRAWLYKRMVDA